MSEALDRQILHVDMDAFFASVEQRDNPALRGKPVVVGGSSRRGVVAAASYEVRKFGVRSAMPMAEALRRCPHLIAVPGRYGRYSEVSRHVFSIFHRFTPLVEGLSLDEAFLDVTASRSLWGNGEAIAALIRRAIHEELELTASAGVAPSKFVAKIASDAHKPDGLCVVRASEVRAFLAPLPIERMWTIGPRSAPRAHSAGFHTIGDLAEASDERLIAVFGNHGVGLGRLARGEDERSVHPSRDAKSIGAEETFEFDFHTIDELAPQLLAQSERVARRLYAESLGARTLTVKIKYANFTVKTRSMQLPDPVSDTDSIYKAALTLIQRFESGPRFSKGIRLTGVSASHLVPIAEASSLFPNPEVERGRKLEGALASLRARFGEQGAQRAALMDRKGRNRG